MSEKASGSALQQMILTQLRDPLRLRFALGAMLIASWYFGFYAPTIEQMALTSARTETEHKRAVTARQIEALRKELAPFQEQIPARSGQNELIQYVMAHVRSSPVKLVDLKPAKIKDLGALDNIGLNLLFEASFEDLDAFLAWADTDHRLLRVDSLKVEPAKESKRLSVHLDLLSLAEKEKPTGSDKPAGGAPTKAKP